MCGSDHMSALGVGYPAVYIIEADFKLCDNHLHGKYDLVKYLDFDHMINHAQMSLYFVYELAFTKFSGCRISMVGRPRYREEEIWVLLVYRCAI